MKDNLLSQEDIKVLYEFIAHGDTEALEFVKLWQTYCHCFDDLVDEPGSVVERIETNNHFLRLTTCRFFRRYETLLVPQIYLAAEAYQASETTHKDSLEGVYLSHEGNNMLRTVALITGGYSHLVECSERIRRLTKQEHPTVPVVFEEFKPAENIDFKNLPQKD